MLTPPNELTLEALLVLNLNAKVLYTEPNIDIDEFTLIPEDLKQRWRNFLLAQTELNVLISEYEDNLFT